MISLDQGPTQVEFFRVSSTRIEEARAHIERRTKGSKWLIASPLSFGNGMLTSPPELHPQPFEIILETPHAAPLARQAEAFILAIRAILIEYQRFLAFAANL